MAARKIVRQPFMRVMLNVGANRYEWQSPSGMSWDELELCGIHTRLDKQSGCVFVPLLF